MRITPIYSSAPSRQHIRRKPAISAYERRKEFVPELEASGHQVSFVV